MVRFLPARWSVVRSHGTLPGQARGRVAPLGSSGGWNGSEVFRLQAGEERSGFLILRGDLDQPSTPGLRFPDPTELGRHDDVRLDQCRFGLLRHEQRLPQLAARRLEHPELKEVQSSAKGIEGNATKSEERGEPHLAGGGTITSSFVAAGALSRRSRFPLVSMAAWCSGVSRANRKVTASTSTSAHAGSTWRRPINARKLAGTSATVG